MKPGRIVDSSSTGIFSHIAVNAVPNQKILSEQGLYFLSVGLELPLSLNLTIEVFDMVL